MTTHPPRSLRRWQPAAAERCWEAGGDRPSGRCRAQAGHRGTSAGWCQALLLPLTLPLGLLPLLAPAPAWAGSIDLICSMPSSTPGSLGTLVDFSLSDSSGSGTSFWPAEGQRRPVLSQVSSSTIQILQSGSGALLFSIDRLNGGISSPAGGRGRCTNAGTVRVERAI